MAREVSNSKECSAAPKTDEGGDPIDLAEQRPCRRPRGELSPRMVVSSGRKTPDDSLKSRRGAGRVSMIFGD